jgi:hypothetical protein
MAALNNLPFKVRQIAILQNSLREFSNSNNYIHKSAIVSVVTNLFSEIFGEHCFVQFDNLLKMAALSPNLFLLITASSVWKKLKIWRTNNRLTDVKSDSERIASDKEFQELQQEFVRIIDVCKNPAKVNEHLMAQVLGGSD